MIESGSATTAPKPLTVETPKIVLNAIVLHACVHAPPHTHPTAHATTHTTTHTHTDVRTHLWRKAHAVPR